ncbi:cation diffusion facilitator family transporter [Pelagibacterium halotolerans]|uniref:Cobalt-zinc-cadmium resistance protein CzcD n=1 Tax=Pelagibacterium halotolerans (strain DSM 22347 / JCM 15775 / CGMCC 1.7692 / B2) TaxID=1082931 RepID=G4RCE0_PELHB|nr:cation diffusion facilitator family transporter [Pelagibacterium halotolerans]AEQ53734.1 cobalt-zinc-cadmium resistance protein CzcD [Pelagibacterium halotolerans B2]QJR20103.1 cation transporter [Pelagibacterium halotolerans]SEA79839.1 cobalt-zinc-cadmium efflux system protein [Pelagibacterium halotolerans]
MTTHRSDPTHNHDHSAHHHGDGHHSHAPEVGENNERVVLVGFALTAGFMVAELIGGILAGSLALVADAGHMLTDAAALALAWAGFRFGRKLSDSKRTFGYMRLEVLAGFVNAITLFALVGWITYEAIQRLFMPHPVLAGPMMVVAVLGLVVNIAVFFMLRQGDTSHVNIRGALLHVLGDLLGSVAAIAAAIVIYFTGWTPIDPILSVLLSVLILRAAWALLRNAVQILMEGTPGNIEIDALRTHVLETVPDIEDVSHVHVWSITSGKPAATMEVSLKAGADYRTISEQVKKTLSQRYAIGHATVEINWANHPKDCPLSAPTPHH